MKILISGSTGLIGKALVNFLSMSQHEVFTLVRRKTDQKKNEIYWNPQKKKIEVTDLENFDAIIHLSGENVFGKWNEEKKKKIEQSRVQSTQFLCETLNRLHQPPSVFISASAIGFYGDQGSQVLSENSVKGKGFLADVCQKWEMAAECLKDKNMRIVNVRTGMVLSTKGGALKTMLLPFKMGLGGKIAKGTQYMSWISIDDLIAIFYFLIKNQNIQGPVNAVSPYPVTNKEFTQTLGTVLNRPTFLTVPATLIEKFFGEMGNEVLLVSQRVRPEKLTTHHFHFTHPVLGEALESLLK